LKCVYKVRNASQATTEGTGKTKTRLGKVGARNQSKSQGAGGPAREGNKKKIKIR